MDGLGSGKKCAAHLFKIKDGSKVTRLSNDIVDRRLRLDSFPGRVFKAEKRSEPVEWETAS